MKLLPLFLVSMAAVGYETALTRYFAVAKWSEYGYWIISIVMAGFALSGVVLALFRDAFARNGEKLLAWLPAVLVLTAAAGFYLTTINPFNPLQLQNPATWESQIWNIAGYYAALLPFFFLAGVFISITFILNSSRIGTVYGYDLTGAGAGAALALLSMYVVHTFDLVPLLLVPLAVSAAFTPGPYRLKASLAALAALVVAEALLLTGTQPAFNDFKAIYAPLNTPDAKVVATVRSPRGDYQLLDDFTERVDTDISNNAAMMGLPGPPETFGLYRDGNRIAALPKPGALIAEITESTVIANPLIASEVLTRLRIKGISLSIDDFGTGHSSLLSLLRLPFSELKIDRSFTAQCDTDPEAWKIVRATISMARELGLTVVAEGIETTTVETMLRDAGCDTGQGWLYGKAMPEADLRTWLDRRVAVPA